MASQFSISDVVLLQLSKKGHGLIVLKDSDHLLRRFGQIEILQLEAGSIAPTFLRNFSEEVWSVINGNAIFRLVDRRKASPSENKSDIIELDSGKPQTLLVPFGIEFSIEAIEDSTLVRITTHTDDADQDGPVDSIPTT
jgi:dTDP-4-dehydrorhamnose 3,5-epimerase-like enzyme